MIQTNSIKTNILPVLIMLAALLPTHATPTHATTTNYEVSTVAGGGSADGGFSNGIAADATFDEPHGIAADKKGNLYVAEQFNNAIRKIETNGNVTTFAGNGNPGLINANGTNAEFYTPLSCSVDKKGDVIVADLNNNDIRKIDSKGNVTTVAGDRNPSFANGLGTNAMFHSPSGVASDSKGNIYVADFGNHMIRKITSKGEVTTLAGNGSFGFTNGKTTNATLYQPFGVAADSKGNVYVADYGNNAIRKIDTKGNVTTWAGSGHFHPGSQDGQGTNATFSQPIGLVADSKGNVYVADTYSHKIRKIDTKQHVTTIAGTGTPGFIDGAATEADFNYPASLALTKNGDLFVADYGNNAIRKITPVVTH